MGRSRRAEDIFLPLVSIGAPIPGLAYTPLFLLWFGLGNKTTVLLVGFVSAFPIIFNTWTGVKAVKEIWVRSAQAMGADNRRLFSHVILPGSLPYILTGLRLGLAQAWRILVGVEMLAAVPWGLGWMIFGAREFLNTDVMLAGVVRHRRDRARTREIRVPAARAIHRRALGDDDVSAAAITSDSRPLGLPRRIDARWSWPRLRGDRPQRPFPAGAAADTAEGRRHADGVAARRHDARACRVHLYRVLFGLALAVAVGLPLGILMGRMPVENFCLPLASALMPIPSLAWVPVFILWFGLGNTVAILIVFYAALFPMLLNAWSGVRAVNPLWLRAAGAMGADERALFWKVIIPGASPFIITGLRQAFLRAWIAVVGAEMLAASDWGLGWVIFDAKEFFNADVMLASLVVIGVIGFVFERLVFGSIERATVMRWGMVRTAKS